MLRSLNPLLSPELLFTLASMGHGDDIAVVDANFPGDSCADRLIRLDGISATDVLEAVLSVMPLDSYVPNPAISMQVVDAPDEIPPVVAAFQKVIDTVADNPAPIQGAERFDFYDRAKASYAIIQTGETRLYGNLLVKKGVIFPD
jgi:L-fucose mutarotase